MAVSITEALDMIYQNTSPVSSELLPVELTLGRIVAQECIAQFDLPRFDNSAMDGYAIKCADAGSTVHCQEIIYAGDRGDMILEKGKAIKIMTGAPIPKGCEAIVPVENVTVVNDRVTLPGGIKLHTNIRKAGEDIKSGTCYLCKGQKVTAYAIAMLASQGVTHISVYRKIRVAVFGTGDELKPHFEKIAPHQLYNSNTPMFLARSQELGCEVRYIGNSSDTMESLETLIRSALDADIILTSGGVSMGDRDFTKEAFSNLGMQAYFTQIDIKPGKPTTYGKIGKCAIVNLPGNPLASMVNYELFVRPLIAKMSGANDYYHGTIRTHIAQDFQIRGNKYTVKLGKFDGTAFDPITKQLPGMISPLFHANAFMVTLPSLSTLSKGEEVKIIPITSNMGRTQQEDFFTV
ncbi:MAG: molybdopterin molybdotransferase MoeA [Campylobacterales bacterium]|nr:molybdopterin molybdotransferase MoeA [Campylobacterales bacterium]